MRISSKENIYNTRTPAEYFQGDSALVGCWPLLPGYGLMDTVSGNHLITSNAVVFDGNISDKGVKFNGTQGLKTKRIINLTGTNKVTLLLEWEPIVYDLTAINVISEFSEDLAGNTTGFVLLSNGTIPQAPLVAYHIGNVGVSAARHYKSTTVDWNFPARHSLSVIYDKSLSTNECNIARNGELLVASDRPYNFNNTNNFGSHTMYFGVRGGVVFFTKCYLRNIALLTRTDIDHADYYAWLKDVRNKSIVSMYIFEGTHSIRGKRVIIS